MTTGQECTCEVSIKVATFKFEAISSNVNVSAFSKCSCKEQHFYLLDNAILVSVSVNSQAAWFARANIQQ